MALQRLLPNLGGPGGSVRKLYAGTVHAMLLYGAPVWVKCLEATRGPRDALRQLQKRVANRICRGYRTVSWVAVGVLSGVPPVEMLARMYTDVYTRTREYQRAGIIVTDGVRRAVRVHSRRALIQKWRNSLEDPRLPGQRTVGAIRPCLENWLDRVKGGVSFHTTQVLTGHGCFDKGGFRLRKWASNCTDLVADIDPSDHGLAQQKLLTGDEQLKVLGIAWNPTPDVFYFHVSLGQSLDKTKRSILSTIAKLFDPLGWVALVIITAKIFMQQLWLLKCQWDDEIPADYLSQWRHYHERLQSLNRLEIPRWTAHGANTIHRELHGFSDALTKAYAASVYLRTLSADGSVTITLLMAKAKVAPLKTISVPRLELSAALLLARLLKFVQLTLNFANVDCVCWTDSTITLTWISQSPARWKTFVANRVSAVQSLLPCAKWRYVPTKANPADCASRGLAPDEIEQHPLWWTGPSWLSQSPDHWPSMPSSLNHADTSVEERNLQSICIAGVVEQWDLATRFSSWHTLVRVTAYVLRFVKAARQPNRLLQRDNPLSVVLDADEIRAAKQYWIKTLQAEMFPEQATRLTNQRPVSKSSSLSGLNSYVDATGIIRVGGRLRHSSLPETRKHPIIFRSHPVLSLIIDHHHVRTMHGGPQLTLASLRQQYWILRARTTVRAVLYRCVCCAREAAKIPNELMGDLPEPRVNCVPRAFINSGVDYVGPIALRTNPGRGHKSHKAYIALFICLTTKAIHLELVSDYSSATFRAAYHRFILRRGLPKHMYSDNGTTFRGAEREMSEAYSQVIREPNFLNRLSSDNTSWHFLPPAAPHFGGLWEAAVKSVKYHLTRCVGNHTLTYEELTTVLCRIEACLNSRPIAASSDNLDDYTALTPGHFLIGTPLIALPEPNVLELNEQQLSRWQLTQRIACDMCRICPDRYRNQITPAIDRLGSIHSLPPNYASRVFFLFGDELASSCFFFCSRVLSCNSGSNLS
ncbi:uncharacterized protein LOC114940687 [Nylanderia fulva]|uniref:uncharacterized protein LOC114940687 n=1 Tax=Nylanderia fulva TaxID=613905 RepID=UPI0010FB6E65|nr:uncharacterized protein LOC114940687 [Nylanderia fulva]